MKATEDNLPEIEDPLVPFLVSKGFVRHEYQMTNRSHKCMLSVKLNGPGKCRVTVARDRVAVSWQQIELGQIPRERIDDDNLEDVFNRIENLFFHYVNKMQEETRKAELRMLQLRGVLNAVRAEWFGRNGGQDVDHE